MDTTRAHLTLWAGRVAIVVGLVVGGWLLCASAASADDGRSTADLARELIERAEESGGDVDIAALVAAALHGTVPPSVELTATPTELTAAPAEVTAAPADEGEADPQHAQSTSSASGSASSTPGEEVEPTTTYGGSDYGPEPGSAAGSESNEVTRQPAPAVKTAVPAPAAPQRAAPPARATPVAPARPQTPDVATRGADTAATVHSANRTRGADRTAPAERPTQPPSPPAPAAPGSGSSMTSCPSDGGGQARGSLGVLATRAHAATLGGGWLISGPRSDDVTGRAAGTPTSTPD